MSRGDDECCGGGGGADAGDGGGLVAGAGGGLVAGAGGGSCGGGRAVTIDRARELVLAGAGPGAVEQVDLEAATGRRLAANVTSTIAVPGFDSSAMDGFAVRAADLAAAAAEKPVRLDVVGESRAGAPAGMALGPGEGIAISTGASLPEGADAIVRIEEVERSGDSIEVTAPLAAGRDVRRAGEDIDKGATVLTAGTLLGPIEIAILASLGLPTATCRRRPRVVLVTGGDELTEPGAELEPGGIYNSNRYSIGGMITAAGGDLTASIAIGDRIEESRAAIERGLEADVLVICGGVSVGPHDLIRRALADCEVEEVFAGIAMKPGRPTWFGRRGPTAVFGLPGNPVSAVTAFALLAGPLLAVLTGAPDHGTGRTRLAAPAERDRRCTRAIQCRSLPESGGEALPIGERGSHVLSRLVGCDLIALIPPGEGPLVTGTEVACVALPRSVPAPI